VIEGSRVLITGGAGMIGSTIADQLIERGVGSIVVIDDLSRGRLDNLADAMVTGDVTLLEGDIRDTDLVARAMEGVDLVFHMAAMRITHSAEAPRQAIETMATGAFNVFEAAQAAGVRKVVAASTASIYGMATQFPTTEDHHPYGNRTLYGALKTFNEGLLRSFNDMYGLDYVALRFFNVYGARMDVHGVYTEVLVRWMERLDRGEAPIIFGDGLQTMDFINVRDVARANILAMESDATDEVFNVASGVETSLLDLARATIAVMGVPVEPEFAEARKVNPVERRLAGTEAAAERLGFRAEMSLEDGLRDLVQWWRTVGCPTPEATRA
jgi:UDP-glucose 4-epimerase